ncbi:zinc ribbon domain-containing protein [Xanthobacter autotrophicus]|uniref:zinc ribbon domain-containing protein n=1 Tax=Xanthobacter autotrophicus TaxID=280 RepID=UPI00372CF87E
MGNKGRSVGAGVALGILLGIFGVLIAACLSDTKVDTLRIAEIRATTAAAQAAVASANAAARSFHQTSNTKDCPRCAETIKAAAIVCRYCGHEFQPQASKLPTGGPISILSTGEYHGVSFTQYTDYSVTATVGGETKTWDGALAFRQYIDDRLNPRNIPGDRG